MLTVVTPLKVFAAQRESVPPPILLRLPLPLITPAIDKGVDCVSKVAVKPVPSVIVRWLFKLTEAVLEETSGWRCR